MTTSSVDRQILWRGMQQAWRVWLHLGLVLALLVLGGGRILGPRIAAMPQLASLTTLGRILQMLSLGLLIGYALWWLLVLGETLLRRRRQTSPADDGIVWQLRLPRPQSSGAQATITASGARQTQQEVDVMLDALRSMIAQLGRGHATHLSLELWRAATGNVRWMQWTPDTVHLRHTIRSLWAGAVPGSDVRIVADPLAAPAGVLVWMECHLRADSAYPLRMREEHTGDPMAPLIGGLTPQAGVQQIGFHLLLQPAPATWQRTARRAQWLAQEQAKLGRDVEAKASAQAMEVKGSDLGATTVVRILAIATTEAAGRTACTTLLSLLDAMTVVRGDTEQGWDIRTEGVVAHGAPLPAALVQRWTPAPRRRMAAPIRVRRPPGVLVADELATHWHLPTDRYLDVAAWRGNTAKPAQPEILADPLEEAH